MSEVPIGQRIKLLIERFKISQNELAKVLDVSQGGFSKVVSGQSIPRFDTIEALYKALPLINPHWLLTGEGSTMFVKEISDLQTAKIEYENELLRARIKHLEENNELKDRMLEAYQEIISMYKNKETDSRST